MNAFMRGMLSMPNRMYHFLTEQAKSIFPIKFYPVAHHRFAAQSGDGRILPGVAKRSRYPSHPIIFSLDIRKIISIWLRLSAPGITRLRPRIAWTGANIKPQRGKRVVLSKKKNRGWRLGLQSFWLETTRQRLCRVICGYIFQTIVWFISRVNRYRNRALPP